MDCMIMGTTHKLHIYPSDLQILTVTSLYIILDRRISESVSVDLGRIEAFGENGVSPSVLRLSVNSHLMHLIDWHWFCLTIRLVIQCEDE